MSAKGSLTLAKIHALMGRTLLYNIAGYMAAGAGQELLHKREVGLKEFVQKWPGQEEKLL
jgi:hypothetical protein